MNTLHHLESCYEVLAPAMENNSEAFAWFTGLPHPLFNAIMHLDGKDPAAQLDRLILRAQGPISVWVPVGTKHAHSLKALKMRNFASIGSCPLMKWTVQPSSQSPKHEIRKADRKIFHEISATNFGFEEPFGKEFVTLSYQPRVENYLVYCDGKAVGAGTLIPSGKIGGIFNMSTLSASRNQGCASSLMHFFMNRARELGLEELVLLSSPETEKFYSGLGFQTVLQLDIYVPQ
ncbi:MAG TPA: GNAT family N-acetyltransferase [Chlamydiales bacterium]|nr:GNAT family N-acetyltransferase [Chlamydiales bacterium]